MASIKIPIICGSKPSKFIPQQSQLKKTLSLISRSSLDKIQGLTHYQLEDEVGSTYSDGDLSFAYDNFDLPTEQSALPGLGCERLCRASCLASQLKRIELEQSLEQLDTQRFESVSHNIKDYLSHRSRGLFKHQFASVSRYYGVDKMIRNCLFQESVLELVDVNKVFCSKWLNNDSIVMGTKCNQLLVYDVNTKRVDYIPCLRGHANDHPRSEQCGIHALETNPSGTLLATGGQSSNEIGIYRLPTLDPVCTGENAHCDWVFDLCWLDDEFLVSASRDKSLAIWYVDEACESTQALPFHGFMQPLAKKRCLGADKVRALLFNPHRKQIVALSLNAKIHVWDATRFKQVLSQKLELVNENVCMAKTDNCSMYAVGSKSQVTLIDPRTLQSINKIDTRKSSPNIRSMSFRGSLLTIGTGTGDILFYDVEAGRFVEGSHGSIELNCSKCKVVAESAAPGPHISHQDTASDSAIYTHCYDWSGTRLFAAGGPLSSTYRGCYASLWC